MSKVSGVSDLSNELAAKMAIPKAQAADIMKNVVEVMASAIVDGGVSIKGVMTIKPALRKGRTGKIAFGENKGKTWKSEDKYYLTIKTGAGMDEELNK